ncbi:hypothetical protein ACVIGA_005982 [Bradyrhizobium sp. USDA 3240]
MSFELIVSIIVVALDGRFLDRAVHALDLAIGPGMLDLGQPMFDPVFLASHIEHMRHVYCCRAVRIAGREGELDPIVSEHCLDLVEISDRISLELFLRRLAAFNLRQSADAVALEAAMQGDRVRCGMVSCKFRLLSYPSSLSRSIAETSSSSSVTSLRGSSNRRGPELIRCINPVLTVSRGDQFLVSSGSNFPRRPTALVRYSTASSHSKNCGEEHPSVRLPAARTVRTHAGLLLDPTLRAHSVLWIWSPRCRLDCPAHEIQTEL